MELRQGRKLSRAEHTQLCGALPLQEAPASACSDLPPEPPDPRGGRDPHRPSGPNVSLSRRRNRAQSLGWDEKPGRNVIPGLLCVAEPALLMRAAPLWCGPPRSPQVERRRLVGYSHPSIKAGAPGLLFASTLLVQGALPTPDQEGKWVDGWDT